ncbi:MAG: FecR domain-containing protein [Pseudomonadota bacterium]
MRASLKLLLLTLTLALTSNLAWASVGRILIFEGDVKVNGEPVTSETRLNIEDSVSTGADSTVTIVLADNSVLDLESNSEVAISEYYYDASASEENTSQIDVLAGTLRYVSGKIAKDDPDNVSFSAGTSTIGVRGTFISISVCPDGGCD